MGNTCCAIDESNVVHQPVDQNEKVPIPTTKGIHIVIVSKYPDTTEELDQNCKTIRTFFAGQVRHFIGEEINIHGIHFVITQCESNTEQFDTNIDTEILIEYYSEQLMTNNVTLEQHFNSLKQKQAEDLTVDMSKINSTIVVPDTLSDLPISKYKSTSAATSTSTSSDKSAETCTICSIEFKDNDFVRYLPCFHVFHVQCIDQWIGIKQDCPNCKIPFDLSNFAPVR